MWYLLIVIVAAGRIHQFQHDSDFYHDRDDCLQDLAILQRAKPLKGVRVVTMECREADPDLNYHPQGEEDGN